MDASTISCGIDDKPASTITVANGKMRHACTMMMARSASAGSPSQYSQPCKRPVALSVQLITLNVESKIHVQAIAASDTGTAHGKRSTNRAERSQEDRIAENRDVVVEAGPPETETAGSRIAETEQDRKHERDADQEDHVGERGAEHHR